MIAGDFNYKGVDLIYECVPPEKQHLTHFIETLQECFLYQHVTEPTRYRDNETPNLLDLIISNEEGMVQNLKYLPPLGESDHVCLRFKLCCSKRHENAPPYTYNIFRTDYKAVKEELTSHQWNEELTRDFVSDYAIFFNILLTTMKKCSNTSSKPKLKKIYS